MFCEVYKPVRHPYVAATMNLPQAGWWKCRCVPAIRCSTGHTHGSPDCPHTAAPPCGRNRSHTPPAGKNHSHVDSTLVINHFKKYTTLHRFSVIPCHIPLPFTWVELHWSVDVNENVLHTLTTKYHADIHILTRLCNACAQSRHLKWKQKSRFWAYACVWVTVR